MQPTKSDLETATDFVQKSRAAQLAFYPDEWDPIAKLCAEYVLHLERIGKIRFTADRQQQEPENTVKNPTFDKAWYYNIRQKSGLVSCECDSSVISCEWCVTWEQELKKWRQNA